MFALEGKVQPVVVMIANAPNLKACVSIGDRLLNRRPRKRDDPAKESQFLEMRKAHSGFPAIDLSLVSEMASTFLYEQAVLTRWGVKGIWRTRAPTASKMALAMAAAVVTVDGSPAPTAC
jgi:hypothetical protein